MNITGNAISAGCVGYKGLMGWGSEDPNWVIEIIKFRNAKFQEDCNRALAEKRSVEAVEREYDTINRALHSLVNLNDNSVKPPTGAWGVNGCCGGDINHC